MFKDIDKEADGEIYYREMVTYLKSLDRDMDQQSNPLVSLVPYLKILVLNTLMRFFLKQKPGCFSKKLESFDFTIADFDKLKSVIFISIIFIIISSTVQLFRTGVKIRLHLRLIF
jgi:hypothetical protein